MTTPTQGEHAQTEALAHELFAAAQLAPGEGIEDAVSRIVAALTAAPEQLLSPTEQKWVLQSPAAIAQLLTFIDLDHSQAVSVLGAEEWEPWPPKRYTELKEIGRKVIEQDPECFDADILREFGFAAPAQPAAPHGVAYAELPDERAAFEAQFPVPGGVSWNGSNYVVKDDYLNSYRCDRFVGQWAAWQARASHGQAPAGAADNQRELLEDAAFLLRKYRRLCVEIGRGDSQHLDRIEAAAVAVRALYAEPTPTAQAAPAAKAEVRRSDLVPGVMHCAKCKFQLNRVTLCVSDGNAYAGDNKTEPCPNGCGPLWPVTWEQEARNCWKTLEEMHERLQAAPATTDFTTLDAAMRAIQQAIGLIGEPADERMQTIKRVLRGAVIVAEDSGEMAAPAAGAVAGPDDDIDAVALARYKVVPSHDSMFHRFAVVAGDGKQQLYLGRETECQNMARKFAGAFLDGAFHQSQIAAAPTPAAKADSVPQKETPDETLWQWYLANKDVEIPHSRAVALRVLQGAIRVFGNADSVLEDAALAFTATHIDYVARFGGRCRDCADESGVCPGSGLPCTDSRKAIKHVFDALEYGVKHGYIKSPIAARKQGGTHDS